MVLPQSMRIKGHRCFDHIYRQGLRFHGNSMLLRVAKAKPQLLRTASINRGIKSCRCAVAISSKVSKKAVIRNRLRRLIHNHLKQRLYSLDQNFEHWALISLKPNSNSTQPFPLLEECDKLLKQAGLIR